MTDSIYSIPRASILSVDDQESNTVGIISHAQSTPMTADAAVDAGIYNVPRSLIQLTEESQFSSFEEMDSQNPFDIYDYPRASMSPDEEGIYDDPLDIVDMEIYDYPPDVIEIASEQYGLAANENIASSRERIEVTNDDWTNLSGPPLPNSARPSMSLSFASNSDDNQVNTCN